MTYYTVSVVTQLSEQLVIHEVRNEISELFTDILHYKLTILLDLILMYYFTRKMGLLKRRTEKHLLWTFLLKVMLENSSLT